MLFCRLLGGMSDWAVVLGSIGVCIKGGEAYLYSQGLQSFPLVSQVTMLGGL